MGLPWPEWGETDALLNLAMDHLEASRCQCGCGQFMDQSHDEATSGRWQPNISTCYAAQDKHEFIKKHGDNIPPGTLIYMTLAPEGAEVTDPLESREYDPERARQAYEEHQRKWGLAD